MMMLRQDLVDLAQEGFGTGEGPDRSVEGEGSRFGGETFGEADQRGWISQGSCSLNESIRLFRFECVAGDDDVVVGRIEFGGGVYRAGDGNGEALPLEDSLAGVEQDLVGSNEEGSIAAIWGSFPKFHR